MLHTGRHLLAWVRAWPAHGVSRRNALWVHDGTVWIAGCHHLGCSSARAGASQSRERGREGARRGRPGMEGTMTRCGMSDRVHDGVKRGGVIASQPCVLVDRVEKSGGAGVSGRVRGSQRQDQACRHESSSCTEARCDRSRRLPAQESRSARWSGLGGKRQVPGQKKRRRGGGIAVARRAAQGSSARRSDVGGGGQMGRCVVLSGIVSHPSRQQSGGENEGPGARLLGGQQSRLSAACEATMHPVDVRIQGQRRKPGTRASCGGGLVW